MDTLAKKLRLRPGNSLLLLNAPPVLYHTLREFTGPGVAMSSGGGHDGVLLYTRNKKELDRFAPKALAGLKPDGLFWVAFPKKSSQIQTDLTMHTGWDTLNAAGYDIVSMISIDQTWSAARVRSRELIASSRKAKPQKGAEAKRLADSIHRKVNKPADLEAALTSAKDAAEFFGGLSYTHQKEYVEWIVGAKKSETRERRIRQAVERLTKQLKTPRS